MKKITIILLMTVYGNVFGMLLQKSLMHKISPHTNIKHFCINNDLLKENNALLRTLIEQNKENNDLLRIIIKQNYLHSGYHFDQPQWYGGGHYPKIYDLYNKLEKEHNIKIE